MGTTRSGGAGRKTPGSLLGHSPVNTCPGRGYCWMESRAPGQTVLTWTRSGAVNLSERRFPAGGDRSGSPAGVVDGISGVVDGITKEMDMDRDAGGFTLFAMGASRSFGERMGAAMGVSLGELEEREFDDGEHKVRPLESVRGRDVFAVHSLYADAGGSVNDKLCRLLFFLGACRDAGASGLTAVTPYLCYARKDRKTKPRDPVTIRYVAQLFEAVGIDRVVAMDVHELAAFQNAFRRGSEHLEARTLFAAHFADLLRDEDEIAVVSPDVGGVKRAEAFRKTLAKRLDRDLTSGFMEKERSRGVVSGETFVGEVEGRAVILLDDIIGTGTTMARAAAACRKAGAVSCWAAATHGIFLEGAEELVSGEALDGVVVTDTVPPFRLPPELVSRKVTVLDGAGLFAEAIRRMHTGGSVVELMDR